MSRGHPDVLQTSNFHIPGRKWQFGRAIPPKFCLQWKWPKITKNSMCAKFWPFLAIWWACVIKIMANYVSYEFWDIRRQKVLINFFFRFLTKNTWFFKKKFRIAQNPLFWAQKPSWMGFPCGFSSKLMEKSQKWFLEKVYRKCVKM